MALVNKNIKRLIKAQNTLKNLAQANVSMCLQEMSKFEKRIEAVQSTVAGDMIGITYTDFYLRHLHGLTKQQSDMHSTLQVARYDLARATQKTDLLSERLRVAERENIQKEEIEDIVERLDRQMSKER